MEVLQITWQEVEIYTMVGREEEKVGNNETVSHNEYPTYKIFAFLISAHKIHPLLKGEGQKTHDSKSKPWVLIIVSTLKMSKMWLGPS